MEAKRKVPTSANIRSVLSPKQIISSVTSEASKSIETKERGFKLEKEEISITNEGMLDGFWEVGYNLRTREKVLGRLEEQDVPEKELAAMSAMYDAVEASVGLLEVEEGKEGVRGVRCMDFWVGRFVAV